MTAFGAIDITAEYTVPAATTRGWSKRAQLAMLVSLWLALGLVEATYQYVRLRGTQNLAGEQAFYAYVGTGGAYLVVALLTPIVFWVGRRWPIERPGYAHAVLVHLAAGLIFPALHQFATAALLRLATTAHDPYQWYHQPFLATVGAWTIHYFATDVLRYWTVVGLYHAVRYYERSARRESDALRYRAASQALQADLDQARLRTLTHQLQPHFLFNALNAISAFVLKEEPERAASLIAHLAELLRISLERSDVEVSLGQELDVVRAYSALETARFGGRLEVILDIDDAALECRLPSFALQTIVENAIRHGVANVPGRGTVHVSARRAAGDLVLTVRDTGRGFATLDDGTVTASGVGIRNTRARLEHLYGSRGALTLRNAATGGALVTLRLPSSVTAVDAEVLVR